MKRAFLTLLITLYATTVAAADVNLTADEKVEWHQKAQKIVAVGNAVATKEDMNIRADSLTGYYAGRENTPKGKSQITKVEARGNVVMKSSKANASGHTMDYDLKKDIVVLTGTPAKIVTDKETITAEDKIIYYPSEQKAIATGNVTATDKQNNKLYSDTMTAYFIDGKTSKMELKEVQIAGNVKIATDNTEVTADRGTYFPQQGKIKLFDNIVINQQGNILKGDIAETDLNSGISKLISTTKGSRVKGIFKEKKKEEKK